MSFKKKSVAVCIISISALLLTMLLYISKQALFPKPELIIEPEVFAYKKAGNVTLGLDVYQPSGIAPEGGRPALVFFFGGGWVTGDKSHFAPQARYFSSRGIVAVTVNYRTIEKHGTTIFDCVKDARSAMRWVRKNADKLGVDPNRIAAGGGSAGGHLALTTTMLDHINDENDDMSISPHANAFILFNPAVDTSALPARYNMGEESKSLSPQHHIRPGLPPGILFHGTKDETVPFITVEKFTEDMQIAGNDFRLESYEDQIHGFFNEGRNDDIYYVDTVRKADLFLIELGYLDGKPTIDIDR